MRPGDRHLRLLPRRAAVLEHDQHQRLPHARGGLGGPRGGLTIANAIAYADAAVAAGLAFEEFAPRLSFFFAAHNDLFEEVAKFRVARRAWARVARPVRRHQPREPGDALSRPDRRVHADRSNQTRTWSAPPSRAWPPCSVAPRACTPTPSTRRLACSSPSTASAAANTTSVGLRVGRTPGRPARRLVLHRVADRSLDELGHRRAG